MTRVLMSACALASLLGSSAAMTAESAKSANAERGRHLYVAVGCYQCHGHSGQGSAVAMRLAPGPLPLPAFAHLLRNPRNVMPVYTRKILSDTDLADIHAYLQSILKPKALADIPLLN